MIGYDCPDFCEGEAPEYQKNSYLIWRFMIDKNYQRKGYGRAAMQQALELVRSFPCGESEYCWISYEPEMKPRGICIFLLDLRRSRKIM